MPELQGTVRDADATNREVRAYGSAWSFSDCWVTPNVLVDTSGLDRVLGLSEGQLVWHHRYPNCAGSGVERSAVSCIASLRSSTTRRRVVAMLDMTSSPGWASRRAGAGLCQPWAVQPANHLRPCWPRPPTAATSICRRSPTWCALHTVTADGSAHWIEPADDPRITARAKLLHQDREVLAQAGLVAEQVHYDDDLFGAAHVAVWRLCIAYAAITEVREQLGLSERVRPDMSWRGLRPLLQSDALFTGTQRLSLDDTYLHRDCPAHRAIFWGDKDGLLGRPPARRVRRWRRRARAPAVAGR
ncbi:MAG: hypothetical protein EA376_00300 [Phycisphaeraceae bacterium]|nr:MAG: hypothetical protein EA376_00300 [Phycisphaeraceae bacterium]